MVPLLSVFSAFSFIIMMFNLPLPGGTTGHAVGVGIAAIVLGPWASILAISMALIIQAVFFGDGGITAIGANCFNMAVIGSLSAYAIYRAISGRAPIESPRRIVAAGVAGYLSINLAALAAAIELGIQPLLYRDSSGAPLYAPYPLHIAIPAMMAGHLTVAGLAEVVVSAGVVAYLQRSDPHLLRGSAPTTVAGHQAILDCFGNSDDPDTARPDRDRIRVGRMVARRFLRSANQPADRGRIGKSTAARDSAGGASAFGALMDSADGALRSSLFEERRVGIRFIGVGGDRLDRRRCCIDRIARPRSSPHTELHRTYAGKPGPGVGVCG